MYDGIEAVTHRQLTAALDAALLRQQIISNNIANANTENFVPQRLNFSAYVREMTGQQTEHADGMHARDFERFGGPESAYSGPSVDAYVPLEAVLGSNGVATKVQLDSEVAQMAQNAVHYQALLRGLSYEMGLLSLAAADGKR